jgi:hypothetical protein
LSTNFWYQNLQTVCEGMVCYHQAHLHDSQLGYQQVQRGPWCLPPLAEIPQVRPLREYQLQHWWVHKDERVAATQLYHLFGKYKLHQYPWLIRWPQGGACAWTNRSST